jgi:hypothetical protein
LGVAVGLGVAVTRFVGLGVAVGFLVVFGVGVALACFFVSAELEFSFSSVLAPAFPSAVKPLAFWKAFTAASVPAPKSPSTEPE